MRNTEGVKGENTICNFNRRNTLGQNNNTTELESVQKFNATECKFRRGLKLKIVKQQKNYNKEIINQNSTRTVKNTYIVSARDNCYKADCE